MLKSPLLVLDIPCLRLIPPVICHIEDQLVLVSEIPLQLFFFLFEEIRKYNAIASTL